MARKIVRDTKNFEKFDHVGASVEGKVTKEFVSPTRYGDQDCIEIAPTNGGEPVCVGLGSNLHFYKEFLTVGKNVRIEYMGKEKNPNTGNAYKVFDVYDLDADEE